MHRRVLPPTLVLIVVLSMIASFVIPVAAAPAAQGPEVHARGRLPRRQHRRQVRRLAASARRSPRSCRRTSKPFEIPERATGLEGALGPQDADAALQTTYGPSLWPRRSPASTAPGNTFGANPPDPNGDVGPNHVVAMSNLSFAGLQQDRHHALRPGAEQYPVGRLWRRLPD